MISELAVIDKDFALSPDKYRIALSPSRHSQDRKAGLTCSEYLDSPRAIDEHDP